MINLYIYIYKFCIYDKLIISHNYLNDNLELKQVFNRNSHSETLSEKHILKLRRKPIGELPCGNMVSTKFQCKFIKITLPCEHPYLQIHNIPWEHPVIRIPLADSSCKNKEQNDYNQNDIQQSYNRKPFNTKKQKTKQCS